MSFHFQLVNHSNVWYIISKNPAFLIQTHRFYLCAKMADSGETCLLGLTTCCLISGASRGFGQTIATAIARNVAEGSCLILLGRNADGLKTTSKLVNNEAPGMTVITESIDFSSYKSITTEWLSGILRSHGIEADDFPCTMLFHNAGTLGDVSTHLSEMSDGSKLQDQFAINVTAPVVLTHAFLHSFDKVALKAIVNTSSLCAIEAFPSWSQYCISRSAREMAMRQLAIECPDLRVLNYAPGPMKSDMTEFAAVETKDPNVKGFMEKLVSGEEGVKPEVTIERLMELLRKNEFKSGSHIDYFDKDE